MFRTVQQIPGLLIPIKLYILSFFDIIFSSENNVSEIRIPGPFTIM